MNLAGLQNKRVLVTGGAGFIGSNLVEFLINNDIDTVCLDNFSTGKYENIESFISNNRFELIDGDIRDFEVCQNACANIDIVFHQAALGSVPRSINDPITTTEVNIGGYVNILFAAHKSNVKRVIYAASSSTYGDDPRLPKEEENIGNPLSPYAITKYTNELYANIFSTIYSTEIIGLRYFNVFGRRQDSEGGYAAVIPKFIQSLLNGKSPIINGDGTHSRDFTYIENVIEANILAATTNNTEAINKVYNIAYGESTDLNRLFILIRENLSKLNPEVSKIDAIHGPERKGDVKHSLASISRARKLLNYNPKFNLETGLQIAIDWYFLNYQNQGK